MLHVGIRVLSLMRLMRNELSFNGRLFFLRNCPLNIPDLIGKPGALEGGGGELRQGSASLVEVSAD